MNGEKRERKQSLAVLGEQYPDVILRIKQKCRRSD